MQYPLKLRYCIKSTFKQENEDLRVSKVCMWKIEVSESVLWDDEEKAREDRGCPIISPLSDIGPIVGKRRCMR